MRKFDHVRESDDSKHKVTVLSLPFPRGTWTRPPRWVPHAVGQWREYPCPIFKLIECYDHANIFPK